ncbi:uncharacterized protein LOC113279057 [Papaver somniferum]|uniref:uncharacterized protein LOC113279057 n=1 Tax=Papaver somniferum TaxID=3469 RepID=UPI000E7034A6|nr:uncharacterized protein LOC113279057 [Papaver somniferum]
MAGEWGLHRFRWSINSRRAVNYYNNTFEDPIMLAGCFHYVRDVADINFCRRCLANQMLLTAKNFELLEPVIRAILKLQYELKFKYRGPCSEQNIVAAHYIANLGAEALERKMEQGLSPDQVHEVKEKMEKEELQALEEETGLGVESRKGLGELQPISKLQCMFERLFSKLWCILSSFPLICITLPTYRQNLLLLTEGIAAIKLDMSKAYYKLEWDFLEKVLTKMGLPHHWVKLTNQCVSTVSYSVLLNGIPTGFFKPKRSLRQGDPLCPYLYIICSQALSSQIDNLQKKGIVEGIKVCKDAPEMTHLLKILEHRKALSDNILDIQSRDLREKYLGTPTVFQASKIQTHMGIHQAVDARITIWLHKLLSQAARTTLIKHIGQAISLLKMGAFLIPKHLCKQMDSHLYKFWWGETSDPKDRKLHLLGWDILCSPKAEGGLGFRKAELNNLAMLAKNAWRIIENPDCLLASVLKDKYFPRTDFLNAKRTDRFSWTWRCLHAIKELIKPFISWIVGDGQFIDPWCDKWIPTMGSATPNPLVPPDPNVKVSYFINPLTRDWDVYRLNTHFDNASVQKIVTIPLS